MLLQSTSEALIGTLYNVLCLDLRRAGAKTRRNNINPPMMNNTVIEKERNRGIVRFDNVVYLIDKYGICRKSPHYEYV